MQDWIAKIKSADYKKLAVDHGEKVVVGVLGLFLLFALIGTSWSRYEKTPEELSQQVQTTASRIAQGGWPEPEKSQYTVAAGVKEQDWKALLPADDTEREIAVAKALTRYDVTENFVWPIFPRKRRIEEPDYLPVEELRAVPSRALLAMLPERETILAETEEDPEGDQFGITPGGLKKEFRPGMRGGDYGPAGGDDAYRLAAPGGGGGSDPYTQYLGEQFQDGGYADGEGGYEGAEYTGYGMGGAAAQRGEGRRFVAVNGVFPLQRQIGAIAAVLNESNERLAEQMVELLSFELERQHRVGDGPWSKWQQVDMSVADEILAEVADHDPEVVALGVVDPAITMPLPMRIIRYWSEEEASHPRLERFELPPGQQERQMELVGRYVDLYFKQAERANETTKRWTRYTYDVGMMQEDLFSRQNPTNVVGQIVQDIAQDSEQLSSEQAKKRLTEQILEQQRTAVGKLLLFRYLDFDVKPGWTYRYQVRVILKNPFYNRPINEVATPEVREGRLRRTPVSQPTEPVTVPKDTQMFLATVQDASAANPPSATFDVFQWSTEVGTIINDRLRINVGQPVAKKVRTEVIAPAEGSFDQREIEFKSNDLLVDVVKAPRRIDAEFHEDLQLSSRDLRRRLSSLNQVLVLEDVGKLTAYRAASDQQGRPDYDPQYKQAKDKLAKQSENFQSLVSAPAMEGEEGFFYSEGEGYGAGEGYGEGYGRRGPRSGNPLRRRSGRGSRRAYSGPMGP